MDGKKFCYDQNTSVCLQCPRLKERYTTEVYNNGHCQKLDVEISVLRRKKSS